MKRLMILFLSLFPIVASGSTLTVFTGSDYTTMIYDFQMVFENPPSFGTEYNENGELTTWSATFDVYDPERVSNPIVLDPEKTFLNAGLGFNLQVNGSNFWNDLLVDIDGVTYEVNEDSYQATRLDYGDSGGLDIRNGELGYFFDPVSVPELAVLSVLAGETISITVIPELNSYRSPWVGSFDVLSITGPDSIMIDPNTSPYGSPFGTSTIPEPSTSALLVGLIIVGWMFFRNKS